MQKYIRLFENFRDGELKMLKAETSGNWNDVRDTVQSLKPFTIINFSDLDGYTRYADRCNREFIKQRYYTTHNDGHLMTCPSIFIYGNVPVKEKDFEKYGILNFLTGRKNKPEIKVRTRDESEMIGNEIVSTLSQNEIEGESHYKLGSVFYKFINFFS